MSMKKPSTEISMLISLPAKAETIHRRRFSKNEPHHGI